MTDLVGTPTELVNDHGGIDWFHRTTLWGNTSTQGGTASTPLRFPGQYHDPETGLNYNLHRHYDPTSGRYTSTDPLGLAAGPNPHRYVANPTTKFDPLGLAESGGPEWMNPNDINFSQRSISDNNYADMMRGGQWDWNRADAPLNVMEVDGQLVTYDNRRLDATREIGSESVPVRRVDPNAPHPDSITGRTWGEQFQRRFNDPRNRRAGGKVPDAGINERPTRICKN